MCGLSAATEDNYSDIMGQPKILNRFVGDDSNKQLEAVGIAGIIVGVLAGCLLLVCFQKVRACCCGSRRSRKSATTDMGSDDKGSDGTDSQTDHKELEEDEVVSNPIV